MKEDIVNTSTSPKETRSVFVGARVTPSQRDHIKSLAEQCGMTVSDYILSCAYNFKPKARLTKEEAALLQNLDNCRSDLVKYTSALHGMSTKQRMVMLNQIPFMIGWLGTFQCCRRRLSIPGSRKGEKQNSVQPSIRRKMIAKAKAISYGINDLRYITGESKHKKHPEKIYRVLDNLLPPELDAMGI